MQCSVRGRGRGAASRVAVKVTVMSCLTIWSTVAVFVTVTRTHSPYATLIDGITDSGGQELSGTPCNLQPLLPLYTCATYSRPLTRDDASVHSIFFKEGDKPPFTFLR